ncbi:NAD(P)H-binding protein [Lentzea sp. NPDC003310]|uniref:NAD(P)-dependent oxidoreductase n=1 Tax=Lentzea sp. NPDC003310 TaxID=3154447 RepID=UPI0033A608EA
MKIAVVGASGMVGSRVVAEALRRGHHVTAVSRGHGLDANDREAMDGVLSGVDGAVVATTGTSVTTVLDAALATRTRAIVVGGAAPLRTPDGTGLVLDDARYVPPHIRPVAEASVRQLRECEAHRADWVYLSPPALLEPGERTGAYRRGTTELLVGPSAISAEDLAVAVLDELERPGADRHFTVASRGPAAG